MRTVRNLFVEILRFFLIKIPYLKYVLGNSQNVKIGNRQSLPSEIAKVVFNGIFKLSTKG